MNRVEEVFALFVDANPVADPATATDRARLGHASVRERGADMQTEDRPIQLQPPRQPKRPRWVVPSLAAAVVAIAIAVVAIAATGGGDETPDVVDTTVTETTQATTTTVAETTPTTVAEAAVPAPLEVVTQWFEAFDSGDVEGWQGLMSPDTLFSADVAEGVVGIIQVIPPTPYFDTTVPYDFDADDATTSRMLYVANGSLNADCADDGAQVVCEIEDTNVFHTGAPLRHTATFVVVDGLITEYHLIRTEGLLDRIVDLEAVQVADYQAWLRETYPADHEELFVFGSMLLEPIEVAERHRARTAEWAAGRG